MLKPLMILLIPLVLTACGNKGALYLPDEPAPKDTTTTIIKP